MIARRALSLRRPERENLNLKSSFSLMVRTLMQVPLSTISLIHAGKEGRKKVPEISEPELACSLADSEVGKERGLIQGGYNKDWSGQKGVNFFQWTSKDAGYIGREIDLEGSFAFKTGKRSRQKIKTFWHAVKNLHTDHRD